MYLGIGSVTVVDHTTVNDTDIRTNFFLDSSSIGTSKAQATAALLQELNEDASVSFENKVNNPFMQKNAATQRKIYVVCFRPDSYATRVL